ncbi:hypothetical protein [Helicobacter sp. MIT 01-3238]|uniref:hypothetical protein n=1 Tax=Helicobacter sp. MIT 01-3238 TaxID=398627 RepID=UPI0015F15BDD|nr:hypothetical protein [Helicobacter sp. MIT 01-3238]
MASLENKRSAVSLAIQMSFRHCEQVARLAWQSIFVFVDCHGFHALVRNLAMTIDSMDL